MAEQALTVVNSRYEMTPAEQHAAYLEEKRSLIISMCIPQEFHDKPAIIDTYFELSRLRRLNPITKEINCIKRAGKPSFETSLAGYRLIASRTGVYAGSDEYVHLGMEDGHPVVSACTVWKFVNGERCPFTASVRWEEFAAYRDGKPSNNWASMPFHMLGKTAETHALRKAFPEETSGLYTAEEMDQSENTPSAPPREVRQAGKPIAQPARIAPLSAPRIKATAAPVPSADEIEWSTDAQVKAIHTIVKEMGMAEDAYRVLLLERYPNCQHPDTGEASSTQLTIEEASDFINYLHDLKSAAEETTEG